MFGRNQAFIHPACVSQAKTKFLSDENLKNSQKDRKSFFCRVGSKDRKSFFVGVSIARFTPRVYGIAGRSQVFQIVVHFHKSILLRWRSTKICEHECLLQIDFQISLSQYCRTSKLIFRRPSHGTIGAPNWQLEATLAKQYRRPPPPGTAPYGYYGACCRNNAFSFSLPFSIENQRVWGLAE